MQNHTPLDPTNNLQESRSLINDSISTVLSQNSGTAFPTTDLQVGMPFVKTDEAGGPGLYVLESTGPSVWVKWIDSTNKADTLDFITATNNLSDVAAPATAFDNIKQAATEGASGVAEIATTAEVTAGTDDTRIVTPAKLAAAISSSSSGLGIGQTWQDVTGSRVSGTSYQNTTGSPIMVNTTYNTGNSSYVQMQISTDNSVWLTVTNQGSGSASTLTHSIVVPNNHYYKSSAGAASWVELR